VECDTLFLGDTVAETSKPLIIEGKFTYTNCGDCTVTEENGPAEIKVLKESHETASVVGEGLVHVECEEALDCSYNGVGLKATAKGSLLSTQKNGEVSMAQQSTNKEAGGFLCPSTSKLDITTTPLSATYITGLATTLCDTDAEVCPGGHIVTHVHEISVSKAKLLASVKTTAPFTVECDTLFLGDTVAETSKPLIIEGKFTYTNCGDCTVTEENGPAEIKVLKESHETASVVGEGLVHVECEEALDCSYIGVGLKATAKGSLLSTQKNGEVSMAQQSTNKEAGGFLCPSTSKLDITTTPLSATYITS